MSETISPTFTFVKDGVFYFSRRIPRELLRHYSSPRIAYSLRTRSGKIAEARARKAADQLDDYWFHLRTQDAQLPGKHMLRLGNTGISGLGAITSVSPSSFVLLSEAVEVYLQQKGKGRPATFQRAAERACGYVIDACGDKQLDQYTKADANAFRDALLQHPPEFLIEDDPCIAIDFCSFDLGPERAEGVDIHCGGCGHDSSFPVVGERHGGRMGWPAHIL